MGSKIGAMKVAAKRAGITFDEYLTKIDSGLKRCWKCKMWKPLSDFSNDKSRSDNLTADCYECRRTNHTKPSKRKRRAMREKGMTWCCGCKQWFPEIAIHSARCRPCRNAYARDRYANNEQYRDERKNHRDSYQRGVTRVPRIGREVLLEDSDGLCVYCGDIATSWDHIIPVSKGGKTTPGNIVPCCHHCNSSKKDQDVFAWIDRHGLKPSLMLCGRIELSALE